MYSLDRLDDILDWYIINNSPPTKASNLEQDVADMSLASQENVGVMFRINYETGQMTLIEN